jgi:hypothetical protein
MKTKRATGECQRKTPDTVSVLYCHLKANVAAVVTERLERRNSRGPSFFVFCVHVFGAGYTFQLTCHSQNIIVKTVMEALVQENVYNTCSCNFRKLCRDHRCDK